MSGNTHRDFDPDDRLLSNQYRYRIVAIAPNGDVSYSNFYELQVEAGIFAPTAFAPNGANNRFFVLGQLSDDFRMTIFDRWGAVVFSTTSFRPEDGWDGMAGGQPAPAGSYAWRVEVRDRSGKQTVKASSVLLIR
jgi:gliding motility-associated-like protein